MEARTPRQVLGAAARLLNARLHGDRFPSIAPSGGHTDRVFIGPTNYAGQADSWARALESARPQTRATSMKIRYGQDSFEYPADQTVPSVYSRLSRRWQHRQLRALQGYTGLLLESARPFLGGLYDSDAARQLQELKRTGVSCALLFHGSDIRDPDIHAQKERHSPFAVDRELRDRCRGMADRSRELIERTGLPVYVSTVGLLSEVEGSNWLPVVIETDVWQAGDPPLSAGLPLRVAHAPSTGIKGTDLIEESLQRLHADKSIDYQVVRGIPHSAMPDVYRNTDVVLDSFRTGNYGVAACEGLAAGRIVVAHISEEVRRRTRELTGEELPIVEATPESLAEVLLSIVEDPTSALEIAAAGPEFVRRFHGGSRSGAVLAEWLDQHTSRTQ